MARSIWLGRECSQTIYHKQVEQPPLTVTVGEQLQSNYQVHELSSDSSHTQHPDRTAVLVNTSLLARIEF